MSWNIVQLPLRHLECDSAPIRLVIAGPDLAYFAQPRGGAGAAIALRYRSDTDRRELPSSHRFGSLRALSSFSKLQVISRSFRPTVARQAGLQIRFRTSKSIAIFNPLATTPIHVRYRRCLHHYNRLLSLFLTVLITQI